MGETTARSFPVKGTASGEETPSYTFDGTDEVVPLDPVVEKKLLRRIDGYVISILGVSAFQALIRGVDD